MARAQASNTGDAHAHGYANTGVHIGDVNVHTGVPVHTNYRKQVARIAPEELVGRSEELAELAEFCVSSETAGAYRWWRAEAWSGKSALMSWFVLHAPPGVRIVSFFVTARWASQNNRLAFISNVLEQLLAILGRPAPALLSEYTEEAHLLGLLTEAAEACEERGERFVLLVDGLDEDRGVTTGPDAHSIAQLLPDDPPAGMRVIIAGRPNPPIPTDVPDDHPLRDQAIVRPLDPSPEAQAIRADMERELRTMLILPVAEQDLLGLLTAAGGGLTAADLTELTGWAAWQVDDHLHTVAGRSFTRRDSRYAQPELYVLGHEELQLRAQQMLGPARLNTYRERLHTWADHYRTQNWPTNTPEYLLGGYYNLLTANNDLARMVTYATDVDRQDRLLDVSGGDTIALTDLATAQNVILEQPDPDLEALGRLVFHRDRLATRNTNIPVALPALWLSLGQPERARTLANSIPDQDRRSEALLLIEVGAITADNFPLAVEVAVSIPVVKQRRTAVAVVVDKARTPAQIECVVDALANGDLSTVDDKQRDDANLALATKAVAAGLDFAEVAPRLLDPTSSPVLFRMVVMWNLLYRTDFPPDLDQAGEALTEVLATEGEDRGNSADRVWKYAAMAMVAARIGDRATCLDLFERARATIEGDSYNTAETVEILVNSVVGVQPERPYPTGSVPTNPPLTLIAESGDVDLVRDLVAGLVEAAGWITETSQRDDTLAVIVSAARQAGQVELALDVVDHFNAPWRPANDLISMIATVPSDFRPRVLQMLEAALGRFGSRADRVDWQLRAVSEVAKAGARERAVDLVHQAVAEVHALPDERALWALTRAAVLLHQLRGIESADSVASYVQNDFERARLRVMLRLWEMWRALDEGDVPQAMEHLGAATKVARRLPKPLTLHLLDDVVDAILGRGPSAQDDPDRPWAREGMLPLVVPGPADQTEVVLAAVRGLLKERNQLWNRAGFDIAKLGPRGTANSFTVAVRTVAEAVELSRALRIVAGRSDPAPAARLFREAIEAARDIDDSADRAQALWAIVSEAPDVELAEQAAREITDVERRSEALRITMSKAVIAGDAARAERLLTDLTSAALALPDFADQRNALTSLVDEMGRHVGTAWVPMHDGTTDELVGWTSEPSKLVALAATAGVDQVARLLAVSERAVQSIMDHIGRGRTLVGLGYAVLEIGDPAWATRLVIQAEGIARFVPDPVGRSQEFTAAVRARGQSPGLLTLAESAAREIPEFSERAEALCDLARVAGDNNYAATVLDGVLGETTALPEDQRAVPLASVITAAVDIGLVDHAETAALLVPDPKFRAPILAFVAASTFQAGRFTEGARLTTRARNIVKALTRRTDVTDVITETAREMVFTVDALVEAGEPGLAAEQLTQLSGLGRYATNSTVTDFVSSLVVETAIRRGDVDRAEAAALSMAGDSQRNSALRSVAEAAAVAGDMDRAEATALSIPDDHHRDWALRLVAVALARVGQVDRAESVARSVVTPTHRGWALLAVVEALPHNIDRARRVLKLAETSLVGASNVTDRSTAFARAAVVATNILGDPEWTTTFLDHAWSDIGGKGPALLAVLRTVVTGMAPDAHPDLADRVRQVTTAMLPTLQWQDALWLLVETWPLVPWIEDMVTDVPVPEIQSQLLIHLAARSEPQRARRLMARAITLVRWHKTIDAFADTYPEVVQAIADELVATAKR